MLWGTYIFQQELVEGRCVEDRQFGRYGVHVYSNRNWLRGSVEDMQDGGYGVHINSNRSGGYGGVRRFGKDGVMGYTYIPRGTG